VPGGVEGDLGAIVVEVSDSVVNNRATACLSNDNPRLRKIPIPLRSSNLTP